MSAEKKPEIMDFDILHGGRSINDAQGWHVGDIFKHKTDDSLLVFPGTDAKRRSATEMASAVAQANPNNTVYLTWNEYMIKLAPTDTPTDAYIRLMDAYDEKKTLKIEGETDGVIQASTRPRPYDGGRINLFDALTDGIRISRTHGGKAVSFTFNKHSLRVKDGDDAEALEATVPKSDRTISTAKPEADRTPPKPQPPKPVQKAGKFTIS